MSLRLNGSTSGYSEIEAPAVAGDQTFTLPGTGGNIITDVSDLTTQVKSATNASGSAPIYSCRAWVNFNGTGTVAIRASGNVSSITDNGTGDYTVNFTTAMPDADYAHEAQGSSTLTNGNLNEEAKTHTAATGSVKVRASNDAATNAAGDQADIRVAIFR